MKTVVVLLAAIFLAAGRLLAVPPVNDNFANRAVLSPGTVGGTLVEATTEVDEIIFGSGQPLRSVWYEFTVPSGLKARLMFTSSATMDARMLVGTGTGVDSLAVQFSAFVTGGGAPGKVAFANTTGGAQTFLVYVANDTDAVGTFTLQLAVDALGPVNDNLDAATALPGAGTFAGDTANATAEPGEFASIGSNTTFASVWYSLNVPAGMRATATLTPAGFDSRFSAWRGTTFFNLFYVDAADNPGIGSIERVRMDNRTGAALDYLIQVDGADFSSGAFSLEVALSPVPPVNDDLQSPANAFAGGTTNGTTVNATSESGEPAHAGSPAARSVWYYVRVDSLNKSTVTVTPSGFDARIAFYRGSTGDFSSLVLVASANVSGTGGAEVVESSNFSFSPESFLLAVDAVGGGGGTFTVNHQSTSAALANDNFASAVVLPTSNPRLMAYNTSGATAEAGEPQLNGGAPQSLWYQLTAPADGKITVATNSNFGPAPNYAIFTGASVNALTTAGAYVAFHSEFAVQQGQTYFIALSTPAGQPTSGSFNYSFRTLDPGQFSFQSDTASVGENFGSVILTVARTSADGVVMVPYTITPGTATTADYTASASGTLQFDDGIFAQEITIPIVDDAFVEQDETFTLTLGTPTLGGLDDPSTVTVTILANDSGGGGGGGGGGSPFQFYVPNAGFTGLINADFAQTGFGFVQFTIGNRVTGKLLVDGLTVPFTGQFVVTTGTDASLTANLKARRARVTLNLTLRLTIESDTLHFTGTLAGASPVAYTISGERDSVGSTVLPIRNAGTYNARLTGDTIVTGGGPVRGFTRLVVKPSGAARFLGVLPDGTRFSAGSRVGLLGQLHFAKGLYKKEQSKTTGYVLGSLAVDGTTNPKSVTGLTHWNKPANNGKIYPGGIANAPLDFAGALYRPPAKGQRALADFNANSGSVSVTLSEGNLAADIVRTAVLDAKNKFAVTAPANDTVKLKLTLAPTNALFGGTFIHPDGKRRTINGILIPSAPGFAEGLFLGTSEAGVITITPQP